MAMGFIVLTEAELRHARIEFGKIRARRLLIACRKTWTRCHTLKLSYEETRAKLAETSLRVMHSPSFQVDPRLNTVGDDPMFKQTL